MSGLEGARNIFVTPISELTRTTFSLEKKCTKDSHLLKGKFLFSKKTFINSAIFHSLKCFK